MHEKKRNMREWKKLSISLAIYTFVCAIVDMYLSYLAYIDDPVFFIHYEANYEAVLFFHYGMFPINYIFFHALYVVFFGLFAMKFFSKRREMIVILSALVILSGFGHVIGGLTWFDTGRTTHMLIDILRDMVTILSLSTIGFYVVCRYMEWRKRGGKLTRCAKCGKITIFTDCICSDCKDKEIKRKKEELQFQKKNETQQPEGLNQ